MQQMSLAERFERQLAEAGFPIAVEGSDGRYVLSGRVDTERSREAVEEMAAEIAGGADKIDSGLEVVSILPQDIDVYADDNTEMDRQEGGSVEAEPDFTDQYLLDDPGSAAGPHDSEGDLSDEGDEVYVPPSDPVVTTNARGNVEVLNGFSVSSMDSVEVDRSAEGGPVGDEALADAVRREPREDAATTDLQVHVIVRNRAVHLRGRVPGMEDADNAEEVASRVPGVREVLEELDVDAA